MSKHTPGSWTIGLYRTTPEFRELEEHVAVMDEDGLLLAITGPSLDKASIADAKLIAAAPELLKACKFVENFIRLKMLNEDTAGYVSMLRDAISKAEGDGIIMSKQ